jgi:hypothetical protein
LEKKDYIKAVASAAFCVGAAWVIWILLRAAAKL